MVLSSSKVGCNISSQLCICTYAHCTRWQKLKIGSAHSQTTYSASVDERNKESSLQGMERLCFIYSLFPVDYLTIAQVGPQRLIS